MSMSNLSIRTSDTMSIQSDDASTIPADDLCEDLLEAAEIAGNDDVVPCSPPPPYDFVIQDQSLQYRCFDEEEEKKLSAPTSGPVIVHTSSKEFYKAVAKQFGLTCKMSDDCRCYECQGGYFDSTDYLARGEQDKSDGGLSAGTPLFINEAMQGSVCNIL